MPSQSQSKEEGGSNEVQACSEEVDKADYKKVYINEDITVLRARLLKYTKDLSMVERAWTTEGKIWALKKEPPGRATSYIKPVPIDNPDDLFELGVDTVDYVKLGLGRFIFV
nr:hypothetical protein BaRGS_023578 [Batillaria attramentaria]